MITEMVKIIIVLFPRSLKWPIHTENTQKKKVSTSFPLPPFVPFCLSLVTSKGTNEIHNETKSEGALTWKYKQYIFLSLRRNTSEKKKKEIVPNKRKRNFKKRIGFLSLTFFLSFTWTSSS